jgi:hypothetical protein
MPTATDPPRPDYSDYDARSRAEVIALISRQAKRIAELETALDNQAHPAKTLLAAILEIVNRYQGRNPEQAMTEIEAACMASVDA